MMERENVPVPDMQVPDMQVPDMQVPDMPTSEASAHQVTRLGQELVRHGRMMHVFKATMASSTPPGLDWAAIALLVQLVRCGPRRQSDIAGLTMLDPSTVSRYAAQLVRQGLAERRPDPEDGRAVQLVATEQGLGAMEAVVTQRNQLLRQALDHWPARDIDVLTDLLARFNDDLEALRPAPGRPAAPRPSR